MGELDFVYRQACITLEVTDTCKLIIVLCVDLASVFK